MLITHKHVVRLLRRHADYLQRLAVQIEDGMDLKEVMDAFICENERTSLAIKMFDHQEFMSAAPSSLNNYGTKDG